MDDTHAVTIMHTDWISIPSNDMAVTFMHTDSISIASTDMAVTYMHTDWISIASTDMAVTFMHTDWISIASTDTAVTLIYAYRLDINCICRLGNYVNSHLWENHVTPAKLKQQQHKTISQFEFNSS